MAGIQAKCAVFESRLIPDITKVGKEYAALINQEIESATNLMDDIARTSPLHN
jgi:hypothetical protein